MDNFDIFLLIIAFIVIAALIVGYVYRCKNCKEWWVRKFLHKILIDERGGYKTVTRYDYIRDKDYKIVNRIERTEQVHITYRTYRNYYRCKKCNYEWTTISTVESY